MNTFKHITDHESVSLIALTLLFCTSCASFKPERKNLLEGYTSEQFSSTQGTAVHETEWWKAFGSEQLNNLMGKAFTNNLTLAQAAARLEQAEASVRKSGAAGKIQINGQAEASSRYTSTEDGNFTDPNYSAGLYASYELDLWQRIKSTERAAQAGMQASAFDMQSIAMTLSGELARNYISWLAQNEILKLYQSQLQSNQNQLRALERRYYTGQSTALAVLQQRQKVASAEAKIPPVKATIETVEHSIAILTGTTPGSGLGLIPEKLPALPAAPATGIPTELLANRPDIQSARMQLESADWNISAAKAARLPAITLTGSILTSNENIDRLFDDWISNLAAGVLAPIIDGGQRKAEVDRTIAVAKEHIAAYRLAVLESIQETEDALSDEKYQIDYVNAVAREHTAALNSEKESISRYQRGILSYLDTLTAIVARESLEITQIQAEADLLNYRIQLLRALGGNWTFILEKQI